MSFDVEGLAAALAAHGPVARVVLAGVRGSTPRGVGTAMLVWPGGQAGTIGGGALEHRAARRARALLAGGGRREVLMQPLGPGLGQCCGGAVTLLIERFDAVPEEFPRLVPVGTDTGMPVGTDTGVPKGRARRADVAVPPDLARFAQGVTQSCLRDGWLIEPRAPRGQALWIWGAGHVGRALVATLAPLPDFAITWVDTAPERFPDPIPEGVDPLVAVDPAQALPRAPRDAAHLIVTYSHDIDLALCHAALKHGFGFCGLIGSRTKWARFGRRLQGLGHGTAQISCISCPIGDPSLGKHPQAIAIGVAAGLLGGQMRKDAAHRPARREVSP